MYVWENKKYLRQMWKLRLVYYLKKNYIFKKNQNNFKQTVLKLLQNKFSP